MNRCLLLALAPAVLCSCMNSPESEPKLLLGATLMDGSSRPPVADAVVVVKEGRITAMGAASDVQLPEQGTRFQFQGKFIFPLDPAAPLTVGGPADLVVTNVNPATDPDYALKTTGRMEAGRWIKYPQ